MSIYLNEKQFHSFNESMCNLFDIEYVTMPYIKEENVIVSEKNNMSGELNPMYGKKRPDLSELNKLKKGIPRSEKTKKKLSECNKGILNPNFDNKWSEEKRKKHSDKIKEIGSNKNKWLGKSHNDETINKMKKPKPEGFSEKMREIALSKPKKECFYCHKQSNVLNITKWHNDNCKFKP